MTILNRLSALGAALLLAQVATAQSASFASLNGKTGLPVQRFDIDWPHSAVEFSVRFMGLSTVRGAFATFGGTLMYNPNSIPGSSISVVIETKSINTNVASRDKDLRSENFFDAEKFPLITFHSEKTEKTKEGFVAHGPLTMHGVTRPVAIQFVQIHPVSADAWGNRRVGFFGHVSLGVVGRSAPQLNINSVGFSITILTCAFSDSFRPAAPNLPAITGKYSGAVDR